MTEISETTVKSLRRQLSEMPSKAKFKAVLRLLIIFLCTFGLVFQTTQLVYQYTTGQTVVNIKIETIKYNRIPAINLCYPQYLSLERVAKKFPDLSPMIQLAKNLSTDGHVLSEIYENITYSVEKLELPINELFDLSLPFEMSTKSRNGSESDLKPIELKVKGIRLNKNGSLNHMEVEDKEPIESIVFPNSRQGFKCFTFFHHLNKNLRDYQMDVKEISIEMFHNEDWYSIDLYNTLMISFSMHSPTSFPQQMNVNNFLRLKAGKWFEMTYNRWKTILLSPPYKTNCRFYDLDDSNYFRMRADCVNQCIEEELNKKCSLLDGSRHKSDNSTKCVYRSDSLLRKGMIQITNRKFTKFCPKFSKLLEFSTDDELNRSIKQNQCINDNVSHLNSECELRCRPECLNRFYNYNVKTNIKHKLKDWDRLMSISIAHNQLPDQITEHIPEMTFVQFTGNFGGLFGMWMGLSALAILQYLLKLL